MKKIIVLGLLAISLHGACSSFFLQKYFPNYSPLSDTRHQKRQSPVLQCVYNRFDEFFNGNTSQFVQDCRAVISSLGDELPEDDIEPDDDEAIQNEFDATFRLVCIPDCGNAILQASEECSYLSGPEIQYARSLCGTNSNEEFCFESIVDSINFFEVEFNCSFAYVLFEICECQSELELGVANRGCCVNTLHDYLRNEGIFQQIDYNPADIYDACGVDLPGSCNNSPLSASGVTAQSMIFLMLAMVIISLIMS